MDSQEGMRRALELAAQGAGEVEPNPRVGALALAGERIVGEGWHGFWGGPHAEVAALADAAARGERPDTVVVTLEPCSTHGKTPPCTEALIAAGVRRVVVGAVDPDPRHAGRGLELLRRAGMAVEEGVLAAACLAAMGPFRGWLGSDRPWVVGKWAMSLDGRIATRTGRSRWITPPELRALAHRLRARVDAVAVGLGTVLADDPELTVRLCPGRDPLAVVVDPQGEMPLESKLVASARRRPLLLLAGAGRPALARRRELAAAGAELWECGEPFDLAAALRRLRREKAVHRVLVEGGSRLLGSLRDLGLLDHLEVHVGPLLMGGEAALGAVGGVGPAELAGALPFPIVRAEPAGGGLRLVAVAPDGRTA